MIVLNDHYMVNPSLVVSVLIEKSEYSFGGWYVILYTMKGEGRHQIGSRNFQTESEAQLFMDYCCEEIDKANGVYKETKNDTEDSIC